MTMMAFADEPGVEVSDMELHRSGKSYTADTVRELSACNPDAELYLVIGTDMLTTFEQWHDFRYLLAQVTLVALARTAMSMRRSSASAPTCAGRMTRASSPCRPSRSRSRARPFVRCCRGGRGSEYLAPNVYAHIIQQRLYGAKPDLNWLREQLIPCSSRGESPMSGAASTRRVTSPSAGAAIRMLPQRPEFCTIARKN